ncbi:MAG: glycosyltransferase family 39 protein [Chloroflexia bacterium]|nr:glycosyltransferase family 39 protein [Chloroflexia bacterium]
MKHTDGANLSRENLLAVARLLAALVLALLATPALRGEHPLPDGVLFTVGAIALFLWASWGQPALERPFPLLPPQIPLPRQQWIHIGTGTILGALSAFFFSDNRLRPLGLLLLIGGISLVWQGSRQERKGTAPPSHDLLDPRLRWAALLAIVVLGAVFRLYRLDTLPADMFNDIAHIHQETRSVMQGDWMIYGTVFPGREPLLFYLNALLARVLGLNFLTLKISTALIGIATLPVAYLLGRQLYNDAVGLLAALFLAVAKWHVLISRVGFRGILLPFSTGLTLYFLLRGLQRGRQGDLLWAGLWAGLGLYTYTAALAVLPAIALGLGLYALAGHWRDLWRLRRALLLAALVALLAALPLLRYMLVEGREQFWSRPLTRVSDQERPLPAPLGKILLGNLARTAGMFHVEGDIVFRTNIPGDPHLGLVSGALFLLGLAAVLLRWRQDGNGLLLSFFLLLLLPTSLALAFPNEVPGAVRAGGAMATVMVFPALAAVQLWQRLGRALPALCSSWGWGGLLAGLAIISGLYNAQLCFVEYPQHLPHKNYPLYREIAAVIDEFGDDGPVWLKSIPYWDDRDAIRLQTQHHKDWGLDGEIVLEIDPGFWTQLPAAQGAVILHPERDRESLRALQQILPCGSTWLYRDPGGQVQFGLFLFEKEPLVP